MQSMTLEQLRTVSEAGGFAGMTLKGQSGVFFVQIATLNGSGAVLAKARSSEPRRFGSAACVKLPPYQPEVIDQVSPDAAP